MNILMLILSLDNMLKTILSQGNILKSHFHMILTETFSYDAFELIWGVLGKFEVVCFFLEDIL